MRPLAAAVCAAKLACGAPASLERLPERPQQAADADTGTVAGELRLLAEALNKAAEERRGNDERIAIAVPKRNVETWIHGLCGVAVDEEYNFKRDPDGRVATVTKRRGELADSRIRPAAGALYNLTRRNATEPPDTMPALRAAIPELRRLES